MRIEIDGIRVNITAKKEGDKYDEKTAMEFLEKIAIMAGYSAGYNSKLGCLKAVNYYVDIRDKIKKQLEYAGYYD